MASGRRPSTRTDPLVRALAKVGDRWALRVVDALAAGPLRFTELAEAVGDIATNILTDRLRLLEREGLVAAQPYGNNRSRVVYELTADGRGLVPIVAMLRQWGEQESGDTAEEVVRHRSCGSAVEVRLWCPTCERTVADDEVDQLHWL